MRSLLACVRPLTSANLRRYREVAQESPSWSIWKRSSEGGICEKPQAKLEPDSNTRGITQHRDNKHTLIVKGGEDCCEQVPLPESREAGTRVFV